MECEQHLRDINTSIDRMDASMKIMNERLRLLRDVARLEKLWSLDIAQKEKVAWSVEGDENSAFMGC